MHRCDKTSREKPQNRFLQLMQMRAFRGWANHDFDLITPHDDGSSDLKNAKVALACSNDRVLLHRSRIEIEIPFP